MTPDEQHESAMTVKDLVMEIRDDMKFVRPAVQQLMDAHPIERIADLELAAKVQAARSRGIVELLGVGRTVLLLAFTVVGSVVAIANALVPR